MRQCSSAIKTSSIPLLVALIATIGASQSAFAGADSPEALVKQLKQAYDSADADAIAKCYGPKNELDKMLAGDAAADAVLTRRLYIAISRINKRLGKEAYQSTIDADRELANQYRALRQKFAKNWFIFEYPQSIKLDIEGDAGKVKGRHKVVFSNGYYVMAGEIPIRKSKAGWVADKRKGAVIWYQRAPKHIRESRRKAITEEMKMLTAFVESMEKAAVSVKSKKQLHQQVANALNDGEVSEKKDGKEKADANEPFESASPAESKRFENVLREISKSTVSPIKPGEKFQELKKDVGDHEATKKVLAGTPVFVQGHVLRGRAHHVYDALLLQQNGRFSRLENNSESQEMRQLHSAIHKDFRLKTDEDAKMFEQMLDDIYPIHGRRSARLPKREEKGKAIEQDGRTWRFLRAPFFENMAGFEVQTDATGRIQRIRYDLRLSK